MTDVKGKFEKMVSKLAQITQDGILKWETVDTSDYFGENETINAVYASQYEGKKLILSKKAYLRPVSPNMFSTLTGSTTVKDYHAELSVYDEKTGKINFVFPHYELTEELYSSASYQTAGIDELAKSLLGDESP